MDKDEFRKVCKYAWDQPHGLVLDLTSKKDGGKSRAGLDSFYIPAIAQYPVYNLLSIIKMELHLKQTIELLKPPSYIKVSGSETRLVIDFNKLMQFN